MREDVIRNAEKAIERYDEQMDVGMTYEAGYDWAERLRDHVAALLDITAPLAAEGKEKERG